MIIAIGGGEVRANETYPIDKFIVEQAAKVKPNLLFIPTASHDAAPYVETISRLYGDLGCQVDSLLLLQPAMTSQLAQQKIEAADIIYVGGGDTEFMLEKWREFRVDEFLWAAYRQGKILAGLSAGSICWFRAGFADEGPGPEGEGMEAATANPYQKIQGLGMIPYFNCPHYDELDSAKFEAFYMGENSVADSLAECPDLIACENQTAIVWDQGELSVLKANPLKNIYRLARRAEGLAKTSLV